MNNENITRIELTFVNAYLIKVSEGFILIDTGLAMHWEKLESQLLLVGCLPDKLKLVIITHGDLDHTGNCAKLQEKYRCKLAMHKDDSLMVENGLLPKRKTRSFYAMVFSLIRKLFRGKFTFDKFKPDIYLSDGQDLNEYGFNATVVHIPGHTKGSIGILTDDGNLFAGDTFTNRRKPEKANYIENHSELENSINRLKKMNIRMIYPGHGKPFKMEEIARKL
jgi:glyoxylase-like metal-dependent hydrolase (beta-lactamase superfamily II)